jgi:hypothetical protein
MHDIELKISITHYGDFYRASSYTRLDYDDCLAKNDGHINLRASGSDVSSALDELIKSWFDRWIDTTNQYKHIIPPSLFLESSYLLRPSG